MSNLTFEELQLPEAIISAVKDLGYETLTSVQQQSIPILLQGHDLLGQAPTGTGKTAAFGLPALASIDVSLKQPQVLVIAPTRELGIQVAEALQGFAKHINGLHVAPIYGGQSYEIQLRALRRGAHVIVGTPGRIMDHMRKRTLNTEALKFLILDEADEMLKMGFLDDVEWILSQIPSKHQTALFSATMPSSVKKIAETYLSEPKMVQVQETKTSEKTIEQCYVRVSRHNKFDVLTRFLDIEPVTGAIIFARTKIISSELADKLTARGYSAAALNGDMSQDLRKKVIDRIKNGQIDIVVATDVAARGIDIDRISHVVNYDLPHDVESYVHRIGRTGRAGRKGKAILFVSPRENRLIRDIERITQSTMVEISPPSIKELSDKRNQVLSESIVNAIENNKQLETFRETIRVIKAETGGEFLDIAAALLSLSQQNNPIPKHEISNSDDDRGDWSNDRRTSRRRDRPNEGRGGSNGRRSSSSSEGRGGYAGGSRGRSSSNDTRGASSEGRRRSSSDDRGGYAGRSRSATSDTRGASSEGRRRSSSEGARSSDRPSSSGERMAAGAGRNRDAAKSKTVKVTRRVVVARKSFED